MRSSEAYTGPTPYLATLDMFLRAKNIEPSSIFRGMLSEYNTQAGQSVLSFQEWFEWAEPKLARDGHIGSIVSEHFIQSRRLLTEMVDFRILVNSLRKKGVLKNPTASLESMLEPAQPTASIRGATGTLLYRDTNYFTEAEISLIASMRGGATQPLRNIHNWLHYLED